MKNVAKAIALKNELDTLKPLKIEDELRIMQKFRLDWNYHSNHLEGNSLNYGETKALILFHITAQGKPLKDHLEVEGHNEAINLIIDIVKQNRPLTENFIRELHKLLLKEEYEVDAITPEGKPTKKKVKVGEYKSTPNHVKTKTGEVFRFATPEETPSKMFDLLNWYKEKINTIDIQPILIAAEFHYRFIRIHPFDDGNGRVARILMNFILMQFGFPPVIIKTEDKVNYFRVLQIGDAGDLKPFIEYIALNLTHSLEIMIKGAQGKVIEEPDDLEKEIALLEQKLNSFSEPLKNDGYSQNTFNDLNNLFELFDEKTSVFDKLYKSVNYSFSINGITKNERFKLKKNEEYKEIIIKKSFSVLNNKRLRLNSFVMKIRVAFRKYEYSIFLNKEKKLSKYYDEDLTKKEINFLINLEVKRHSNFLKELINRFNT